MKTELQFEKIFEICREIYSGKLQDYGASWRILRPESLTDQIYIKANRIRTIEITGKAEINEGVEDEYKGIINYSIISLIQLKIGFADKVDDIDKQSALEYYDKFASESINLMKRKNHDYGEAWRSMRVSSYTDLILSKIFRIKQIEDNKGKTIISEGIEANYFDIINYSIFALIKIYELQNNKIFES